MLLLFSCCSVFQVARYNSVAQHQTIQHTTSSPLLKCRGEVLRIMELLSEKEYTNVADLMIPVFCNRFCVY